MRNDFKPVHLKEANAKLDRDLLSSKRYQKENDMHEGEKVQISLWQKFLSLFTTNPFDSSEEHSKNR